MAEEESKESKEHKTTTDLSGGSTPETLPVEPEVEEEGDEVEDDEVSVQHHTAPPPGEKLKTDKPPTPFETVPEVAPRKGRKRSK